MHIQKLCEGDDIYKKFSSKQLLGENSFDPLNSEKYPPENCGYGI
jgi:hypothetical protein